MLRRRRFVGAALVAALTVPLVAAAVPAANAGQPATPDRAAPTAPGRGPVRTVTLLTGDRVSVTANGAATITHGPATRAAPHALSRTVQVSWTFRSGHVPGTRPQRLPVSAVRFAPKLNADNAAKAGRTFTVPVTVQPQPDSAAEPCRTLTVEVSFDNGRTWRKARVTGTDNNRVAHLRHPRGAGYVSLRASATDAVGNTVRQTLLRAYRLRP